METVIYDLAVCGGGPAGTSAALTAARMGARVLLLERGRLPRDKVCGEFISPESLGLLGALLAGTPIESLLAVAPRITRARFFADGALAQAKLQPPAASIPRRDLDHALWQAAEVQGVDCFQQTAANEISRLSGDGFHLRTSTGQLRARTVIDASGRWSNLGRLPLSEIPRPQWIALKAYFAADEDEGIPSVDLYFFRGGYCGVQPVAPGRLNVAAMVRAEALESNGLDLLPRVFALEPRLDRRSRGWRQVTDLVATSPLLFRPPAPEREAILRAGDAAGFVDPFVGDGISLALLTGAAAAEALSAVWKGAETLQEASETYRHFYRERILPVFAAASRVRRLLAMPVLLRRPLLSLLRAPGLTELLVRKTRLRPAP